MIACEPTHPDGVIGGVTPPELQRAIETVWRLESPKLIAGLTRLVRDLALAEDLAHDALVAALEQWPTEGTPRNPAAWLMAAAKHRAIDHLRRRNASGPCTRGAGSGPPGRTIRRHIPIRHRHGRRRG